MQHLLFKKMNENSELPRSTQILRVSDVRVVMHRFVPALWCVSATTDDQTCINSYFLRMENGDQEPPQPGALIVADLLTMTDLAGDFNEIVSMQNLSAL